jgi:hypothetical protein
MPKSNSTFLLIFQGGNRSRIPFNISPLNLPNTKGSCRREKGLVTFFYDLLVPNLVNDENVTFFIDR